MTDQNREAQTDLVWYREISGKAHAFMTGGEMSLCGKTTARGIPVGFGTIVPRQPCATCVAAIERRSWRPGMARKTAS